VQSERSAESLRSSEVLRTSHRVVPLVFSRSRKARRYILRVTDEGAARITIPRGGSKDSARLFARQHAAWVQQQLQQLACRPRPNRTIAPGCEIFYRGRKVVLCVAGSQAHFGDRTLGFSPPVDDFTDLIREHLWELAERELVPRALELAGQHGLKVFRVLVRNQRSRWGSCSMRRTICLNWRLIQAPAFVSDYLILHELMHLREMNHSGKFWRQVASVCPRYAEAEQWLDEHDYLLRQG
jgi:predicted metal-dependent hydrolase